MASESRAVSPGGRWRCAVTSDLRAVISPGLPPPDRPSEFLPCPACLIREIQLPSLLVAVNICDFSSCSLEGSHAALGVFAASESGLPFWLFCGLQNLEPHLSRV